MINDTTFLPPRRTGLLIHSGLSIVLLGSSALAMVTALNQKVGSNFVWLLLVSLALLPLGGLAVYRGYALYRASYVLQRDGLFLSWGLRTEDIPLSQVEWVRPAGELGFRLPLPVFSATGAILGVRHMHDLGTIEFMASETETMLLVATPKRIFVISPADPKLFMRTFQRTIELGSLAPLAPQSTVPAVFLARVWKDKFARILLMSGLLLTVMLFVLVGVSIPGRRTISLGFDSLGKPLEPVPSAQMLLLPVMAALVLVGDFAAGLYTFRKENQRPMSYLLWACGALIPALLIVGALFILK